MKVVTTNPNKADKTVMVANAEIAERKTVILLLVIAKMAGRKQVLAPNSETRITLNASTNPCKNP